MIYQYDNRALYAVVFFIICSGMNHLAYFYIAIEPIPSVEFNGQFNKGNGEASALSRFLRKNK